MLENAVYAVLSPEGFATILWKDAARCEEACEIMKMTAQDLMGLGVIDEIVLEPEGGAHLAPAIAIRQVDQVLRRQLAELSKRAGPPWPRNGMRNSERSAREGEHMNGIKIKGTGKGLPRRIMTNEDMAKIVETSDEWITTRTGIQHCHHVSPGGRASRL